jgi:PAB-dependent poly(A)-specific ribonuclease subunit 2
LRSSIIRETWTKANCSHCKAFAPLLSRRALANDNALPPVISVNAMVSTPEVFEVWRDKADRRFLPPKVCLRPSPEGELQVSEEGEGVAYGVKVSQGR